MMKKYCVLGTGLLALLPIFTYAISDGEKTFDVHAYPGIMFVDSNVLTSDGIVTVRNEQGEILGSAKRCKDGNHAIVRLPANAHGKVTIEFDKYKQSYDILAHTGSGSEK